MPRAAGVLLTGGSSRRLGVDKARLRIDGETLAVRAAARLGAVCADAVEVGTGVSGLRCVREHPVGAGPLAAFAAGAAAVGGGPCVLLAVDLPNVDEALLDLLAGWPADESVIPVVDGRSQLVCARYESGAGAVAEGLLAGGERSLRALESRLSAVHLDRPWRGVADASTFADVDTPEDAADLGIDLPR